MKLSLLASRVDVIALSVESYKRMRAEGKKLHVANLRTYDGYRSRKLAWRGKLGWGNKLLSLTSLINSRVHFRHTCFSALVTQMFVTHSVWPPLLRAIVDMPNSGGRRGRRTVSQHSRPPFGMFVSKHARTSSAAVSSRLVCDPPRFVLFVPTIVTCHYHHRTTLPPATLPLAPPPPQTPMSTSLAPASVRRGYGCQREVYHPLSKHAEPTALTYYDSSDEEDEGKVQKGIFISLGG